MTTLTLRERILIEREIVLTHDDPPAAPPPAGPTVILDALFRRLGTVRRPAVSAPRTLLIEDKRSAR